MRAVVAWHVTPGVSSLPGSEYLVWTLISSMTLRLPESPFVGHWRREHDANPSVHHEPGLADASGGVRPMPLRRCAEERHPGLGAAPGQRSYSRQLHEWLTEFHTGLKRTACGPGQALMCCVECSCEGHSLGCATAGSIADSVQMESTV